MNITNNVKYFYIRQDNVNSKRRKEAEYWGNVSSEYDGHRGEPIACVAYVKEAYGVVKWALATVHPKDGLFHKQNWFSDKGVEKGGRTIATERLRTEFNQFQLNAKQTKAADIHYVIMKSLAYGGGVNASSRVVKAAKRWLHGDR